jgi:hypothetical protein
VLLFAAAACFGAAVTRTSSRPLVVLAVEGESEPAPEPVQAEAAPAEAAVEAPKAEMPSVFEAASAGGKANPDEKEFDITQYSMTLLLFVVFCIVKALSYFGIYNPGG